MKKFTLLVAAIAVCGSINAQKQDVIIDDFENGEYAFTDELHINPVTEMQVEIADNPAKEGINPSEKSMKFTRIEAVNTWAGTYADLKQTYSDYSYMHIMYYRDNENSRLRINAKDSSSTPQNNEFESIERPTKTGEWEWITFDLKGHNVTELGMLGFQPDFTDVLENGTVVYIDNITLSDNENPAGNSASVADAVSDYKISIETIGNEVSISSNGKIHATADNLTGSKVAESENDGTISLQLTESGIYLIAINANGKSIAKKVIIR